MGVCVFCALTSVGALFYFIRGVVAMEKKANRIIYGNNLKLLRKSRGYTQEYVANSIGIMRATYAKIESGVSYGNMKTLFDLAKFYNTTAEALIGNENKFSYCLQTDKNLILDFENICNQMGLTTETAFNLFIKTVIRQKKIPFEINI